MASSRIKAEHPRGAAPQDAPDPIAGAGALAAYEEDAARVRGSCAGLFRPRSEGEVAAILARATRERRRVLVQGARSSLTGGATPREDWVISTEALDRLLELRVEGPGGTARAEPGLRLRDLNDLARAERLYFPPVPTYDLCCLGGAVATNAAGAVTWKHGSVRGWVRALRVALAWGDVIAVRRGEVAADEGGGFWIERVAGGAVRVPLPTYRTPLLKKVSCGYFARDGMDLVDLFIGAEGTLGVVTEVEVALAPAPACVVSGLATLPDEAAAIAFARDVRAASEATWACGDPAGVDVRAIEYVDAASFELLRERGRRFPYRPPAGACAIIWEQELAARVSSDEALGALGRGLSGNDAGAAGATGPAAALAALSAFGAILARAGGGEDALVSLPDDPATGRTIAAIREAVPEAVNELIAARKRDDPRVRKVAADMAVPFERLSEWLARAREGLARRGIAHVVFGHVSDGNLHVNALPRSGPEADAAEEALLELGDLTRALGGAPLAEHGVGKSKLKQELLRRFHGDEGLVSAGRTKRALDPGLVLAIGNVFPQDHLERAAAPA